MHLFQAELRAVISICREKKEVILMTSDKDIVKEEKKDVEAVKSEGDDRCCYVVADPCGCYVDPCGAYVDARGCCVDPCCC